MMVDKMRYVVWELNMAVLVQFKVFLYFLLVMFFMNQVNTEGMIVVSNVIYNNLTSVS